jgi:hypothetical protein
MTKGACFVALLLFLGCSSIAIATSMDTCASGSLGSVVEQGPCRIGALVFDFSGISLDAVLSTNGVGVLISPFTISFTPLTDQISPGFSLSDFPVISGSSQDFYLQVVNLKVGLGGYFTGLSAIMNDVVFTGGENQSGYAYSSSWPTNLVTQSGCSIGGCGADDYITYQLGNLQETMLTGHPPLRDSRLNDQFDVEGFTSGPGTLSIGSANFTFDYTAPEPATLLLMLPALVGLWWGFQCAGRTLRGSRGSAQLKKKRCPINSTVCRSSAFFAGAGDNPPDARSAGHGSSVNNAGIASVDFGIPVPGNFWWATFPERRHPGIP